MAGMVVGHVRVLLWTCPGRVRTYPEHVPDAEIFATLRCTNQILDKYHVVASPTLVSLKNKRRRKESCCWPCTFPRLILRSCPGVPKRDKCTRHRWVPDARTRPGHDASYLVARVDKSCFWTAVGPDPESGPSRPGNFNGLLPVIFSKGLY